MRFLQCRCACACGDCRAAAFGHWRFPSARSKINVGAFLSLGESLPKNLRSAVFTFGGLVLVTSGVLWILFARATNPVKTVGAALVCAGGLGNVIDRLCHSGGVTDFLNVGIGSFRTGIFNVADMALMLGVALLLVPFVRSESPHRSASGSHEDS